MLRPVETRWRGCGEQRQAAAAPPPTGMLLAVAIAFFAVVCIIFLFFLLLLLIIIFISPIIATATRQRQRKLTDQRTRNVARAAAPRKRLRHQVQTDAVQTVAKKVRPRGTTLGADEDVVAGTTWAGAREWKK